MSQTIGSIVRIEITQIRMLFIVEQIDLYAATFNENIGYHVSPEYGPFGIHLRKLSSEIHEEIYHSFEMDRSRLGDDLQETLKLTYIYKGCMCSFDTKFMILFYDLKS